MSVNIWSEGEIFTARIYKRLVQRPDVLWANTYELRARAATPDAEGSAVAALQLLAAWESTFHLSDVQFDRGVFSTHVADGQPYNPTNLISWSLTDFVGEVDPGAANPAGLQICLLVRRVVSFGRTGRLLYRRVLHEAQIDAPAGDIRLSPGAGDALNTIVTAPLAEPYGPGPVVDEMTNLGLDFVMVGNQEGQEGNIRVISGFQVAGVTVKPYNNAYYNRSTPPAP